MGYVLTSESKIFCPHGGLLYHRATRLTPLLIAGYPVLLQDDEYRIEGCRKEKARCVRAEWDTGPEKILIFGSPVLIHTSRGWCIDSNNLRNLSPIILHYQRSVTEEVLGKAFAK